MRVGTRTRWLIAAPAAAVLAMPLAMSGQAQAQGMKWKDLNKIQQRILSGGSALVLQGRTAPTTTAVPTTGESEGDDLTSAEGNTNAPSQYFPTNSQGCPTNLASNIKVNQNCQNV